MCRTCGQQCYQRPGSGTPGDPGSTRQAAPRQGAPATSAGLPLLLLPRVHVHQGIIVFLRHVVHCGASTSAGAVMGRGRRRKPTPPLQRRAAGLPPAADPRWALLRPAALQRSPPPVWKLLVKNVNPSSLSRCAFMVDSLMGSAGGRRAPGGRAAAVGGRSGAPVAAVSGTPPDAPLAAVAAAATWGAANAEPARGWAQAPAAAASTLMPPRRLEPRHPHPRRSLPP